MPEEPLMQRSEPVLQVRNLVQSYATRGDSFNAVDNISFEVRRGETLGLVGESGCGKSSTARTILDITAPTSGEVYLDGRAISGMKGDERRAARRQMQLVFQDPYNSVNPRWTVSDVVAEPLLLAGRKARAEVRRMVDDQLHLVGLDPSRFGDRTARQLSGGQAQRVGIARALVTRPELLICDEPVSGLDVSVQAQILSLFADLKSEFGLTTLFISHDLAVISHVSDRVAVMYLGKIVEIADAQTLFADPRHPYTALLMGSVLEVGNSTSGNVYEPEAEVSEPQTDQIGKGCRFRDRCPFAQKICADETPQLVTTSAKNKAACHFPDAIRAQTRTQKSHT